jgi:hypothetical protein
MLLSLGAATLTSLPLLAHVDTVSISPEWGKIIGVSRTRVSVEVCVEPPMRRGYPIHDKLFSALRDLRPDYARLSLWDVYPRIGIAELRAPEEGRTYWDFILMDEVTEDFMKATAGHPVLFNLAGAPRWMFRLERPLRYPDDPDAIDWSPYSDGRKLNDATVRLFAQYQGRVASWYMRGGFQDEYGTWHASNHRYKFDQWEVLNEPIGEYHLTPEQYTRLYDAAVEEVRRVAPEIKFTAALQRADLPKRGDLPESLAYFTYFLDPRNHRSGIPIDWVSYHFYATADSDETPEVMEHTIFQHIDRFLTSVRAADFIRRQLSPQTGTVIDELGSTLPGERVPELAKTIPKFYWNLAGAMWAYAFGNLAVLGIDVVHAAELIDYPGQYATTTLIDWNTGNPTARYWVVKLLRDNFNPGDKLVQPLTFDEERGPNPAIQLYVQGFVSPEGLRKLLIVNKRSRPINIKVPSAAGGSQQMVDEATTTMPEKRVVTSNVIYLPALAVAVVDLAR